MRERVLGHLAPDPSNSTWRHGANSLRTREFSEDVRDLPYLWSPFVSVAPRGQHQGELSV